ARRRGCRWCHQTVGHQMAPSWHRGGTVATPWWHHRGTVVAPSWHRWHCGGTIMAPSWHHRGTLACGQPGDQPVADRTPQPQRRCGPAGPGTVRPAEELTAGRGRAVAHWAGLTGLLVVEFAALLLLCQGGVLLGDRAWWGGFAGQTKILSWLATSTLTGLVI